MAGAAPVLQDVDDQQQEERRGQQRGGQGRGARVVVLRFDCATERKAVADEIRPGTPDLIAINGLTRPKAR